MLRWWPCAPCVDVSSAKAIFLSVTNLDWLLVSGRATQRARRPASSSGLRFKERPSSFLTGVCRITRGLPAILLRGRGRGHDFGCCLPNL
eukprot:s3948_g5.t1